MTSSMLQPQSPVERLMKDQGWRGALTIFMAVRYQNEDRIWRHVDLAHGRIDWVAMLREEGYSTGEYLMITAACSLYTFGATLEGPDGEDWNPADINLWGLVARLDEENLTILMRAIAVAAEHPAQWSPELA